MSSKNIQNLSSTLSLNHQDEIEDIIGHPPNWILHWGIFVVLFFVVIFCSLAGIVKYPDVLPAPIILTTENPAIRVLPEKGGRVELLFAKDQDTVIKDQALLLLESKAIWKDVQLLQSLLASSNTSSIFPSIPRTLILGNMQSTYTTLVQEIDEFKHFSQDQSHQTNSDLLQNQILHYEKLNNSIVKQSQIFKEEMKIVSHNYEITQQLFDNGAASMLEVESVKLDYLSKQRQLENMESQILNNQIRIEQLQTQITNTLQARTNRKIAQKTVIMTLVRQLKNDIATWEKQYLIKAPINGILSLNKIWSKGQFVEAHVPICTIIPKEISPIIARAKMPAAGIGKVEIGTKANIRLIGFPEQEYGILRGQVKSIAMLPESEQDQNNTYFIELALINDLNTSYNKTIPFQYEMSGMAELITEEKSILQRILNQSLNLLKNN